MIRMGLSTGLRMLEPEIRHTTSAQPTRMIRFHVRTRERPTDGMSVGIFLEADFWPGIVEGLYASLGFGTRCLWMDDRAGRTLPERPPMDLSNFSHNPILQSSMNHLSP